jgi:GrpB-like predicted nucleotidyltransferase (UPF0157 family)/GNAT superfamily N-acetyltransferase
LSSARAGDFNWQAGAVDPDPLRLEEADPLWAARFETLAGQLRGVLMGLPVEVEHVGSTSVPGLAAKPILDIDVVVPSAELLVEVVARLDQAGYRHKGMRGVAGREAFDSPTGDPSHHLYAVVAGSKPHLDHVLFRDLLRHRSDLASRYEAVKRANAARLPNDLAAYTDAKTEVVAELLAIAREGAGVAADPDAVEVDGIVYRWRAPVADSDVVDLHAAAFPGSADSEPSWWRRQRPLSLGWVTAHAGDRLVGFANLAWDGHRHSFLLDVAVHPDHRRRNIGSTVIERAVAEGRAAGCEWLHVDFEPHLARFYQRAGFLPTAAGLRRLM